MSIRIPDERAIAIAVREKREQIRSIQDSISSMRLTIRDYDNRRQRITDEIDLWQRRLERLDAEHERATSGGIEAAEARIARVERQIETIEREPKIAMVKAIRAKLARELGVPEDQVKGALDEAIAKLTGDQS